MVVSQNLIVYSSAPLFFDFLIFSMIFVSVSLLTLGERFKGHGRASEILSFSFGIALSLSLVIWEYESGFNLGRFGPYVWIIFLLSVFFFIIQIKRKFYIQKEKGGGDSKSFREKQKGNVINIFNDIGRLKKEIESFDIESPVEKEDVFGMISRILVEIESMIKNGVKYERSLKEQISKLSMEGNEQRRESVSKEMKKIIRYQKELDKTSDLLASAITYMKKGRKKTALKYLIDAQLRFGGIYEKLTESSKEVDFKGTKGG